MPSGYTARIYEGENVTFPEFAMECARAFGALITMRDDPPGVPIPDEFTPEPYYAQNIERARRRLAEVQGWTAERAEAEVARTHAEAVRATEKSNAVARVRKKRYEAMLTQVQAWEPPTPDHRELKKFMADQLEESIHWDGRESSLPERPTGERYREHELGVALRDVDYYTAEAAKEEDRARGRSEWVKALRRSLPVPEISA